MNKLIERRFARVLMLILLAIFSAVGIIFAAVGTCSRNNFAIGMAVVSLVLAFVLAAYSLLGAVYQGRYKRMHKYLARPYDLMAALVVIIWMAVLYILQAILGLVEAPGMGSLADFSAVYCVCGVLFTLLYIFIIQYCARLWWDTMLFVRILRRIPVIWLGIGLLILNALALFLTFFWDHWLLLLPIVPDVVAVPVLLVFFRNSRTVMMGAGKLSKGDLDHEIKTERLFSLWKTLGENLNSIRNGMSSVLEERMKSERMKTELITNVSHDLKTPLTSVINYIALLQEEGLSEETRREYLAVLARQGAKLKKLTEDVVEASKAASGVLTVCPEELNAAELLAQCAGEYGPRMQEAGLEPILRLPDEPANILADGNLLGRVLENLMTNVLKYAQGGTRVYFDLELRGGLVYITSKNISREQLNISAEELMERFVRGDRARHSEGSGLGLSIAKSLTELMGGKLNLFLDGDLFKAELVFEKV